MIYVVAALCFIGGAAAGWFWKGRIGGSDEQLGWEMACLYKKQADEMIERIVELEDGLME